MTLLYFWVFSSAALGSQNWLKWLHPVFSLGAGEGHLLALVKKE
jgi:hypothetical protein